MILMTMKREREWKGLTEISSLDYVRHSKQQVPDRDAYAGTSDCLVPVSSDGERARVVEDGREQGRTDDVQDGAEHHDVDEWDAAPQTGEVGDGGGDGRDAGVGDQMDACLQGGELGEHDETLGEVDNHDVPGAGADEGGSGLVRYPL